jgi:osmotically inducible protein OsmC
MAAERSAQAHWQGDLVDGGGTIDKVPSGAFGPLDVSWAARTEESGGKTSPEELIAAAWSACFAMAFANILAKAGNPPERLDTSATLTFQPGAGIIKGALTVRGTVPGMDGDAFKTAAEEAKQGCPVSQALTGIPDVTLDAALS